MAGIFALLKNYIGNTLHILNDNLEEFQLEKDKILLHYFSGTGRPCLSRHSLLDKTVARINLIRT